MIRPPNEDLQWSSLLEEAAQEKALLGSQLLAQTIINWKQGGASWSATGDIYQQQLTNVANSTFKQMVAENCPESWIVSLAMSETPCHEACHGEIQPAFLCFGQDFIVFAQAVLLAKLSEGRLDDPTPGEQLEPLGEMSFIHLVAQ